MYLQCKKMFTVEMNEYDHTSKPSFKLKWIISITIIIIIIKNTIIIIIIIIKINIIIINIIIIIIIPLFYCCCWCHHPCQHQLLPLQWLIQLWGMKCDFFSLIGTYYNGTYDCKTLLSHKEILSIFQTTTDRWLFLPHWLIEAEWCTYVSVI